MTTPLIEAAKENNIGKIQELLDAGLSKEELNAVDEKGRSALYWSAYKGHAGLIVFLAEEGADFTQKKEDGTTPLSVAARKGHIDTVEVLLTLENKNGASIGAVERLREA